MPLAENSVIVIRYFALTDTIIIKLILKEGANMTQKSRESIAYDVWSKNMLGSYSLFAVKNLKLTIYFNLNLYNPNVYI